ncbi:MAG TPA: tagaturonate reductase [Chitinophagaceae bacterium]|nr:tagaturonate reductase [Chitinophagaceae bacterium]
MFLSRYTLKNIQSAVVVIPPDELFELPEKVLQFGTGVLLRGLPDYFIDKANRLGIFNGRIVVVKSTDHGDTTAFDKQDGLYTLCVRGLQNGTKAEENIINSSISRVLSAKDEWDQILECAHDPNMQVIISNTTEVGIQLVNDDVRRHPPVSFPGKLLSFLYERYQAFNGSPQSGMVIIPTELIPDNGRKLESIVLELAHLNGLPDAFIEWLEEANHFCSSLVDRIVPGKPSQQDREMLERELGYHDQLLTTAEVYRLWAIEGDEYVKQVLSFCQADEGVIIEPDIDIYRELKLRLLNGTHTLSCGLAFVAGFDTVKQAMDDKQLSSFVQSLMLHELAPVIPYAIEPSVARAFGASVLDRFRNPHIRHQWINITVQYSSKMRMRNLPMLLQHYRTAVNPPELFCIGFAAWLLFMKGVKQEGNKYFGQLNGAYYPIEDDKAADFYHKWNNFNVPQLVEEVLGDTGFWGTDLNALPGFAGAVTDKLHALMNKGARTVLENAQVQRVLVQI